MIKAPPDQIQTRPTHFPHSLLSHPQLDAPNVSYVLLCSIQKLHHIRLQSGLFFGGRGESGKKDAESDASSAKFQFLIPPSSVQRVRKFPPPRV